MTYTGKFIKLEGLGNDFIMLDCADSMQSDDIGARARDLCDRRRGVGADGVICVLPPLAGGDCRIRIFNADGGEAEMCGNGIRCLGEYLRLTGRGKDLFSVETLAGVKEVEFLGADDSGGGRYRVNMGAPIFNPDDIPVIPANIDDADFVMRDVTVLDRTYKITAVSMGNPHAVVYVDKLDGDDLITYAPAIQAHSYFPKSVNVEFVRLISDSEIMMRVYERGCGETHACGTGACAAVASGVASGLHGSDVTVHLIGGDLQIFWDGDASHPVYMSGQAKAVFSGEFAQQ